MDKLTADQIIDLQAIHRRIASIEAMMKSAGLKYPGTPCSAVKGRQDFRQAYRDERAKSATLRALAEELAGALAKIERWRDEFPATGKFWPSGDPISFGVCHGANGERDYMRGIARAALSRARAAGIEGSK